MILHEQLKKHMGLNMTKDIYKVCPSQKELDAKDRALEQLVQEPVDVARVQEDGYVEWRPDIPDLLVGTKLYTHPAQSWKPLSDEEIEYMWEILGDIHNFARAIEKAHGIKHE